MQNLILFSTFSFVISVLRTLVNKTLKYIRNHFDMWGTFKLLSMIGNKYFTSSIDEYNIKQLIYLSNQIKKDKMFDVFKRF